MSNILDTGIKNARNVRSYMYGFGQLGGLGNILDNCRGGDSPAVFFIDHYFEANGLPSRLNVDPEIDPVIFIDSTHEPKTGQVNALRDEVMGRLGKMPCAIVGLGGGTTLDIAKAVSNLLTNGGNAEDYQGWDLVKKPGVFKIGIPTISGTGAESTRTCVMTNPANGLKLGMNSDFTVFNQIILDPELTATVPRNQYFYTGMDAYIHCLESSAGSYRNAVGDAFGDQTLSLCRKVFLSDDMTSDENRARLMVASYLGGCAIATSYVGLVHPFSAGLSIALDVHHCIGNCIAMRAMEEYYPEGFREFWKMAERQQVEIPKGLCENLTDEQYEKLFRSTIIHEKPLTNALGPGFRDVLTYEKVIGLFRKM
jgi:3-deoxy-alpha-D-manno-octulosonate 8-oxidase